MKIMEAVKLGFGAQIGFALAAVVVFFVAPCLFCGGMTTLTTMLGAAGQVSKERRMAEKEKVLMPREAEIEALLQAYEDNPISAESVYGNSILTVRGGIAHKVDTNSISGDAYVRLVQQGDEFGLRTLRCNLKSKEDALKISAGAPVDVKGILMGKSMLSVQLDRCEVVETR